MIIKNKLVKDLIGQILNSMPRKVVATLRWTAESRLSHFLSPDDASFQEKGFELQLDGSPYVRHQTPGIHCGGRLWRGSQGTLPQCPSHFR
jgi:hypothetical protein